MWEARVLADMWCCVSKARCSASENACESCVRVEQRVYEPVCEARVLASMCMCGARVLFVAGLHASDYAREVLVWRVFRLR